MRRLNITWKLGLSLAVVNLVILSFWTADAVSDLHLFLNDHFIDSFHPDREGNVIVWYSAFLLTLLAVAALVNFWLDRVGPQGASSRWRFAWLGVGIVALLLSLEEVAQIHEVIQYMVKERTSSGGEWSAWIGKTGRAWLIPYLPFILAVVVGLSLTFRHMFQKRRAPLLLATAAIVLWVFALLMEFFLSEFLSWGYFKLEIVLEEAGEILGSSALLVASVWYGEARWRDIAPALPTHPSVRETQQRSMRDLRVTWWLGLCLVASNCLIVLLWIIGLRYGVSVFPRDISRLISPAQESNFTTWYSGLLLTLAAFAAAANFHLDSKTTTSSSLRPFMWLGVCAVTLFLSLDELAQIHEGVEGWVKASLIGRGGVAGWIAADGRAWLIPYLPFILGATVGLFAVFLHTFQHHRALRLWAITGICLWLFSLILAFFASEIGAWGPWYRALELVVEETAEIFGSSILLVVCVWYGEKHWRQIGFMLDMARPPGASEPSC